MDQKHTPHISDNEKIDALLSEAFDTRTWDVDKAIDLANDTLANSIANNYEKGMAYSNCYLGLFHMIKCNYELSANYADEASNQFEALGDKSGLALNYYTIGSLNYKRDNTHLGLKYLLDSFELYQLSNNLSGQARTLKAIGTIYEYLGEYDNAEATYHKAVAICDQIGDKNNKSNVLNPLSGIYTKRKEFEKALGLINSSIDLKKETNDLRGLAFSLYGKGKVLASMNKHHEAVKFYLEGLELHKKMEEELGQMMCLNKLGYSLFELGEVERAKKYLEACVRKGVRNDHYLILQKAQYNLYKIYKHEGNFKKALEYIELHITSKEKIINKEIKNIIKSIQAISKTEMLEKESKWQKEINEKIEKKNAELDKFVYKVSHDLRGPVSSLMGLFNLIEFEVSDPQALKYFNIYNDQVNLLNERLVGFIDLIQVRDKKIENKTIDFRKVVDECIASFNYLPHFSNAVFNINIDNDIHFQSDESSINTIFQNLIENSLKYSKSNAFPEINIEVFKENGSVNISVQDNGEGIKAADKEKVFEMFYRANNRTKGTGLGLYLIQNATEKLSGKISLDSEENNGTKVAIELPALN
ncbi:MAG: tetratricopeptide repeat protein [Cyclobacteriaceae bacterium]